MAKSVLGRGLGDLLEAREDQAAPGTRVYVSPGVKTILQAGNSHSATATGMAESRLRADYWPLVRLMLFASDLILLLLSGLLVWRAGGALTWIEVLACVCAVTSGALIACAAVVLDRNALVLLSRSFDMGSTPN